VHQEGDAQKNWRERAYKRTGDLWERMLIFTIDGIDDGAVTACRFSVLTSWMPAGEYKLEDMLDADNCEWGPRVCFPTDNNKTMEFCFDESQETIFCALPLPPVETLDAMSKVAVELAVDCHELGIHMWQSSYV